MAPDIRSFFGGKPASASQVKESSKSQDKAVTKKKGRTRVVIDSDDEEELAPKEVTPRKAAPRKSKREPSPEGLATTSSDYFATNGKNKPKRSEATRPKTAGKNSLEATPKATPAKAKTKSPKTSTSKTATPDSRKSSRQKKSTSYAETKDEDGFPDDDMDGGDDIFQADLKKTGKAFGDEYMEDEDDDDEPLVPQRIHRGKTVNAKVKEEDDFVPEAADVDMKDVQPDGDFVDPDDDEEIVANKPATASKARATRKRKTKADDEDEEDEGGVQKKSRKSPATKKSPTKKQKQEDIPEDARVQAIFDSIPTVRAPTPPPKTGDAPKKFNYHAAAANSGPAAGSEAADLPTGAESCLAGLTFVFTGLLDHLGREEGQALVKKYGGKVTTAPSSKTSYVVLGNDAGPKKIETIHKFKLKTINEGGLFELIRRLPPNGGDGKAAVAWEEKKQKEAEKVREMAAEIDKEERRVGGAGGAGAAGSGKTAATNYKGKTAVPDTRLWTVKYAPSQITQICGNKTQVEKLQRWLRSFPKNQRTGFKMPGPDGSGTFRAVIIHGPPGIGKTTAAHLVAKLEGYDIVESNASDTRSKKLVETGLKGVLSTTSLFGYFAGDGQKVDQSRKKLVLIMDEVDGMSAGDRGGVGALAAVCKKTQVPMILICNDRKLPKMKPFDFCTYDLPFRRPTTDQIKSRIMTIAYREGLKMPGPVVEALIEGSGADIRQVVNMVSTAKLDQDVMDFNQSKSMSKAWQKHVVLKPWDIVSKILGGGMFAQSSKATLNDKIELYFNDHEFSYLMLQENYLGTSPILAANENGRKKNLKLLELVNEAAESISDGDLVDRMIHGSQQQWSLMPAHAVFSFVRPASFVAGSMAGHRTAFTSWLGKNSSQGRLTRMIKEIQGHMRLRSSGDRHEIRQQYVPVLWTQLVKKLASEGKDAVPDVIDLMDSYFLTKDDWDAILELGVCPMDMERVKLETQTKATFTRLYNSQSHPLPFMKASNVVAPKKQAKEKPDLEEAMDESDEGEVVEEVKDEEDEDTNLSKDKYIKQPKKKAAAKKAAPQKSSGNGKKKAKDGDLEEGGDSEEDLKPKKKSAAKAKAPAKGKAKK
ncbi:replication factor RFC1 C terminal domain-containing protein [Cryomyces antarcticus]|nr:DNA replication factor C complex subunit Rfc1 [Cryomyces antarcticus]